MMTKKKIAIIIGILIIVSLAIYGWLLPNEIRQPADETIATPTPIPIEQIQKVIINDPERDYEIVHEPVDNLYIISILKPDFDLIRPIAEQDLMTRLGITAEQACTLKVTVTAPFYASPEAQQVYNKFSFCP